MSTSLQDVCFCCLESENLLNIFDDYSCEDKSENYCAMLKEGFDIKLYKEQNASSMCLQCVMKLREAYYFREKVLDALNLLFMQNGQTAKATFKLEYLEDEDIPAHIDIKNKLRKNEPNLANLQPSTKVCYVSSTKKSQLRQRAMKHKAIFDKDIEVRLQSGDKVSDKLVTKSMQQTQRPYQSEKEQRVGNICRVQFPNEKSIMEPNNTALVCDVCGKGFQTNKQLLRHLKSHETGPFACDTCDKTFTNINTLHAHKWRLHTDHAPFRCRLCGVRFRTYHGRASHLRETHGAPLKYPCPHCDNVYNDSGTRTKHIRYSHLKERPHKCSHCVKEFPKPHLLKSHLAYAHKIGEKKFQCDLCSKKFSYKSTLQYHIASHDRKKVLAT